MVRTNNILIKKTLRTVKTSYKQFLSIIMISFLAICLYTGLTANHLYLAKKVNTLYEMSNMADAYFTYQKVADADTDYLRNCSNISMFETRTVVYGNLPDDVISLLVNQENSLLNVPKITSGKKGFLISANLAKKLKIKIGDEMVIEIPNHFKEMLSGYSPEAFESLVKDGKTNIIVEDTLDLKVTVTGFMLHGEGVANSSFTSSVAYTDYNYLKSMISNLLDENYETLVSTIFNDNYDKLIFANQIIVKSDNPNALIKEVSTYYETKKENSNLMLALSLENLSSNQAVMQDVDQADKLTKVFPIIFFLVSVLVISTTLSQMIYKERTLIGTMKAVGVSKFKIINHYASYGFLLCLVGSLMGVIIGPLIIPKVMNIKYALLWELPNVKQDLFHLEYLWCILVLLFLSWIVSFFACYKEVNLLPVESMRPAAPKIYKSKGKHPKAMNNKQISLKMAIRNIFRSKIKSTMVIVGVAGCTALLVCGFGIMDTLNYGIDYDFNQIFNKELTVTYLTGNKEAHKEDLKRIEGIKKIEEVILYPIKITGSTQEDTTIYLLEENSAFFKGNYQKDGVMISKELANSLHAKVGDQVTISLNGKTTKKTINEIFSSCVTFGIIDVVSNYENLPAPTQAWINLEKDAIVTEVLTQIKAKNYVSKAYTKTESIDNAHELLNNIKMMTNVVKVFAILLAVVVIYNLTSLNMKERTRDIATMKVLGFNQIEISRTLVFEIMILTLVGAFIGLFFGYPILVLVLKVNTTKLLNFMYHVYFKTYVISFLISSLTALVVNLFLVRRTRKIAMVESLKSTD